MSTPTAIEIVRAYIDARVVTWGTQADVDLDCALASVLRDADRLAALERAIRLNRGRVAIELVCERCQYGDETATLAELADRLREEGAK